MLWGVVRFGASTEGGQPDRFPKRHRRPHSPGAPAKSWYKQHLQHRGRGRVALRRIATVALLVALSGCASAANTVATAQNSYDYRLARYTELCVVPAPPATCAAKQTVLK